MWTLKEDDYKRYFVETIYAIIVLMNGANSEDQIKKERFEL